MTDPYYTGLDQDLDLTVWLQPYYHCSERFNASNFTVSHGVHIPDGPFGYVLLSVPRNIRNAGELLAFLVQEHDFHPLPEANIVAVHIPKAPLPPETADLSAWGPRPGSDSDRFEDWVYLGDK